MNLYSAKKVVVAIQEALGLAPATVPENEFRAELSFIAANLKSSDSIQVRQPEDSFFKNDNDPEIASLTIFVFSDNNGSNVTEENVLKFTYYGGSGSPAGPRHGLAIDLLPKGQRLYWRRPGQNPVSEWEINALAENSNDFEFTPYILDRSWMPQETFYALLHDEKADEFLGIDGSTPFLAEIAYLNYLNTEYDGAFDEEGIDFDVQTYEDEEGKQLTITIRCNNRSDITPLKFIYSFEKESEQYALTFYEIIDETIGDDDAPQELVLIYDRDPGQDEATEWYENCMANDPLITDENGKTLFIGNPI